MKPPKQVNPGQNRRSQAPYNFVPLPDKVYEPVGQLPVHSCFAEGRHSGYISLSVTTKTWLYTRAAVEPAYAAQHPELSNAVWKDENSPYRDFFHHGKKDRPVIPGSALRGMLRQIVEIISDGQLSAVSKRPIVYRAVADQTRLGQFYRERFVGPNQAPSNAGSGQGLRWQFEYPLDRVRGGYIFEKKRKWFIRPAKIENGYSFVRFDERNRNRGTGTFPVWVQPAARSKHSHRRGSLVLCDPRTATTPVPRGEPQPNGMVPGYLVVTDGVGGRKHMHLVVYEPDMDAQCVPIDQELRDLYLADARMKRDPGHPGRFLADPVTGHLVGVPINCSGEHAGAGTEQHRELYGPCFYMVDECEKLVFFGGTLFFRLPYKQSIAAFVNRESVRDLPSRLFGAIADDKSVKGRLRFDDLLCEDSIVDPFVKDENLPNGYGSPEPLLQPKPACIQHYLVQTSDERGNLLHYDDIPSSSECTSDPQSTLERNGDPQRTEIPSTTIRGFKHYWHRKGTEDVNQIARERTRDPGIVDPSAHAISTVIRPVRDGITFKGRLYFDNLSDEELGALLVALRLQSDLRHKLGMGRPFGYGSVRIDCTEIKILDPKLRYSTFFTPDEQESTSETASMTLQPGWKNKTESKSCVNNAIVEFARNMAKHRNEEGSFPKIANRDPVLDRDSALDHFWKSPRMMDLAALLDWVNAPNADSTRPVNIEHQQWKERKVLPPPLPPPTSVHGTLACGFVQAPIGDQTHQRLGAKRTESTETDTVMARAPLSPNKQPPSNRPKTLCESVELVGTVTRNQTAMVLTKDNLKIRCSGIPAYPQKSPGTTFRAEITRAEGQEPRAKFHSWD